jgi:hypothetical protein
MKTRIEMKTVEYYAETECYKIVGEKNENPIYCGGDIDCVTGICKKCGGQSPKTINTYKTGIEWLRVSISNGESATFHYDVENDQEYSRKLIAAIRRAGDSGCNMFWSDGCKNPDGYDGTYGRSVGISSMSCHGRYSLTRI